MREFFKKILVEVSTAVSIRNLITQPFVMRLVEDITSEISLVSCHLRDDSVLAPDAVTFPSISFHVLLVMQTNKCCARGRR